MDNPPRNADPIGHVDRRLTYNTRGLSLLDIGQTTLSRWRRQGLRVRYLGGKLYVRGSDLADFIHNHGKSEKDAPP